MAMPTIEDFKAYCGIDYADDMVTRNANRALGAAVQLLKGSIAADIDDVLPGDDRVAELVLIYAEDLYSGRGTLNSDSAKVSGATRRLVNDIETQLRMEYRLAKEGAV